GHFFQIRYTFLHVITHYRPGQLPVQRPRLLVPTARQRVGYGWRLVRALYRDARVIWREFRQPILVFLVAVFAGGWLYGELLVQAGHERLPYMDLPYLMAALMIFAAPNDMPLEPQLVFFWYLMPLVGAYIAGRGVFDFIQLFFNPNERHNTWEVAVASTYRNHVIVLGVGHLGRRVIRALVQMGVEIVAIDQEAPPDKSKELKQLGVPLVVGDGRLLSTIESAGIRHAQALIVCTSNDYMNLEVTMRARDLNPDIRIVVRMWEDQFVEQIRRFLNVEAVLSATNLAAPSFAGYALGIEITQTLTVNDVDYSMIRLTVKPGSFMDGKTIGMLQDEHNMDIVLHGSDHNMQVHPPTGEVVRAGDTLVIFAQHSKIIDLVSHNRRRRVQSLE
ncbi:MAG: TrkA family potassium uptake protein, partial [Anaerolineae bacterium]|nr:TrkA family potassium uptake protein [Anaerolineae bacterium]